MTIVWAEEAIADLKAVRDYIAEFNPHAAADTALRFIEAVEILAEHPAIGRPGRKPHTRELVIPGTPYIVLYCVTEGRIEIIAVIHGARKWPD